MNTPPTPKRHKPAYPANALAWIASHALKDGQLSYGIRNPEYALLLARIVTEFEHLEDLVAFFLADLAGTDVMVAAYMLRAVKSPRARRDMLRTLLDQAERNQHRDAEYHEVIREFAATANLRNTYVHGRWWTGKAGRLTLFAPTKEDRLEILNVTQARKADLRYVLDRIHRTAQLINRLELPPEQRALTPKIPPLKPPPDPGKSRPKTRPRAPRAKPRPSPASPRKKRPPKG